MEGEAIGRSSAEEGKLAAQLRSAAYTGAQQQAQSAFENQQKRGQTAAQLFQGLGTGIGALGEAAQSQGFQDVNTLFNTGALEQRAAAGGVRRTAGRSARGSIRTVCSVLVHAGHSFWCSFKWHVLVRSGNTAGQLYGRSLATGQHNLWRTGWITTYTWWAWFFEKCKRGIICKVALTTQVYSERLNVRPVVSWIKWQGLSARAVS